MKNIIQSELNNHIEIVQKTIDSMQDEIEIVSKICIKCIINGNKIMLFGNGGSAADAQHIAAELVGRYKVDRKGLSALALTTDTSVLTSIGNDFGFEEIYSRQIEALANSGDIAIGISTSGNSINIIKAFSVAKEMGCQVIGLSGSGGGKFKSYCDINLVVPSKDTPRIQEIHILIGHIICHLIESKLSPKT